jgi:hypothetical protein
MRRRVHWLVLLLALNGCAQRLPAHAWAGPDDALETLRQRAESVRTLQSAARVVLARPDGETVHLDAALIAGFPDHLRLRAWKLGQTVFDLTWTPGGLWVDARREEGTDEQAGLSPTAAEFAAAWSLFDPGFFSAEFASVRAPDAGPIVMIERRPSLDRAGATVLCEVDRATLTPRRYTVLGPSGVSRATLTLDRYQSFDGIVWPTRIEARGPGGSVVVFIDSARFNETLPERAFVPPAGAVKQP